MGNESMVLFYWCYCLGNWSWLDGSKESVDAIIFLGGNGRPPPVHLGVKSAQSRALSRNYQLGCSGRLASNSVNNFAS